MGWWCPGCCSRNCMGTITSLRCAALQVQVGVPICPVIGVAWFSGGPGWGRGAARLRRHAPASVYVHADEADHLAGLPAPVPVELPGPAAAGQGPAVGAQQPRRERAQCAGRVVAAVPPGADRAGRRRFAGARLDRGGLCRLPAVIPVPGLGAGHGGVLRDRAGPGTRAGRGGAHGGDSDRPDRGLRQDRPPG